MPLDAVIADNLRAVRRRLAAAAQGASRDPADVQLIAVSKTFSAEHVRAAARRGPTRRLARTACRRGSRRSTSIAAPGAESVEWHLIGHLQSNKARKAAAAFQWIHSIDSLDLLKKVDDAAGDAGVRPQVLIQVDLAHEATKHGADETAVRPRRGGRAGRASRRAARTDDRPADPHRSRGRRGRGSGGSRELRDRLVDGGLPPAALRELSMGMSHDFEVAIAEGATMVRVGTAIFGERTPRPAAMTREAAHSHDGDRRAVRRPRHPAGAANVD